MKEEAAGVLPARERDLVRVDCWSGFCDRVSVPVNPACLVVVVTRTKQTIGSKSPKKETEKHQLIMIYKHF